MSVKVDIEQFWQGKEVKIQGKKVIGKSIFEIGFQVEQQAKQFAPKDTGLLAGSITTQAYDHGTEPTMGTQKIQSPLDENEVLVGTPIEYGTWMEFGTGPHDIYSPVLIKNKWVYIKRHPGTPAQPFLRPALDLAKGKTLTIMEKNGRIEFKDYLK